MLVCEPIHQDAINTFKQEGYTIETAYGLSSAELGDAIKQASIVCIRSQTQLTADVLAHASKLWAVGAFCIGTNQVDLATCTRQGIAVFNAPYSNTRSVVELTMSNIIALMRRVHEHNHHMHHGVWDKTAVRSYEVRGKKLGIVGYGNIGTQLSVLAEHMGMQVYYHDVVDRLVHGNAHPCSSLRQLLETVDVVTVHVDGRSSNRCLIGKHELACMRKGSYLLNLSRGHVVDIDALVEALGSGHIAGAALDVFPQEPKTKQDPFVSPLVDFPQVILTPHIGGSTQEAQEHIGRFVSQRIITYMNTGDTTLSVNMPHIQLSQLDKSSRIIHIHTNEPGVLGRINDVFGSNGINIEGQYLKTQDAIGYVIVDVNKKVPSLVLRQLREIPGTIRVRVLY